MSALFQSTILFIMVKTHLHLKCPLSLCLVSPLQVYNTLICLLGLIIQHKKKSFTLQADNKQSVLLSWLTVLARLCRRLSLFRVLSWLRFHFSSLLGQSLRFSLLSLLMISSLQELSPISPGGRHQFPSHIHCVISPLCQKVSLNSYSQLSGSFLYN